MFWFQAILSPFALISTARTFPITFTAAFAGVPVLLSDFQGTGIRVTAQRVVINDELYDIGAGNIRNESEGDAIAGVISQLGNAAFRPRCKRPAENQRIAIRIG